MPHRGRSFVEGAPPPVTEGGAGTIPCSPHAGRFRSPLRSPIRPPAPSHHTIRWFAALWCPCSRAGRPAGAATATLTTPDTRSASERRAKFGIFLSLLEHNDAVGVPDRCECQVGIHIPDHPIPSHCHFVSTSRCAHRVSNGSPSLPVRTPPPGRPRDGRAPMPPRLTAVAGIPLSTAMALVELTRGRG